MVRRLLAVLVFGLLAFPAARADGRLDTYPGFASKYVLARDVTVWVPDGYDPKGPPMSVLYMQDGENLYEPSHSLSHADWQVARTVSQLIRDKKIPPVIVVGMASTPLRGREYLPRKIAERLPQATRDAITASWNGAPLSDDYLRFLVEEVKPFVDARYNTRHDPAHTFVMGSSMGGLISFYAMAEYPDVFGGAACLSMHWLLGSPLASRSALDLKTYAVQVVDAFDAYLAGSGLTPSSHRLYIDRGDATLDAFYVPFTPLFEAKAAARGWHRGDDFESEIFPAAEHSEVAWADRLAIPLEFLLRDRGE